jgi:hypothetical protein
VLEVLALEVLALEVLALEVLALELKSSTLWIAGAQAIEMLGLKYRYRPERSIR